MKPAANGWFALAALLAFLCLFTPITDYDVPWHIASGRWILEHGRFPTTDVFSYSHRGLPWQNHSPGFQVVLAYLVQLCGIAGATLLPALIGAALVFCNARLLTRSAGVDPVVGMGVVAVGMLSAGHALNARPQLVSFAGLTLALWMAMATLERPSIWRSLAAVLCQVAWVLGHGSHVLMPVVMLGAGLFAAAHRSFRSAAHLAVIGTAALLLSIWLAPGGFGPALAHAGSSFMRERIGEWAPLSVSLLLDNSMGWVFILLVVGALAGGVLRFRLHRTELAVRFELLALCVVLLALPFGIIRLLPLFLLGMVPLWGPSVATVADRLRSLCRPALARAVVLAAILTFLALSRDSSAAPLQTGFSPARFPIATVDAIERQKPPGRIFNSFNHGGYLIFRNVPPEGVLIDGRAMTIYPPAFLSEFAALYADPQAFERFAGRWQIGYALVPAQSTLTRPLIDYLRQSPGWRLAASDPASFLFVRRPAR